MKSLRQAFHEAEQKVGPFARPLSEQEVARKLGLHPPIALTTLIAVAERASETRTIVVILAASGQLPNGVLVFAGSFNYNPARFKIRSINLPGNALSGTKILTFLRSGTTQPAVSLRPGEQTGPQPIFGTATPASPVALTATLASSAPAAEPLSIGITVIFESI